MSGTLNFNIDVLTSNAALFPELAGRAADLSPVWDNIIKEWAKGNEDKFAMSRGAEATGAQMDGGLNWEADTPRYSARKRKDGFADWLMVRTGDLKRSLTDASLFFSYTDPQKAMWGVPKAAEEEAKLNFNWEKRQVVFLGLSDRLAIKREILNYFSLGAQYKDILFARGLAASQARRANAKALIEFNDGLEGAA